MRTFSLLRVIPNFLRNLFRYKAFFVVCDRFNNFAFEIINPLKRRMVYPCELFRLFILFAKEVFITIFNLSFPPNLSPNVGVFNK